MWSKLEAVFKKMGLPYSRQGSYSDESEYPLSFFTFWNPNTNEASFYDNKANKAIWYWDVFYYTRHPQTLYSKMAEFIEIAKEEGFITGKDHDIQSDRADYPGRTVTVIYIEDYQKQEV